MRYADYDEYASRDVFAIDAVAEERAAFMRRTYSHLGAAVMLFVALVTLFLGVEAIRAPLIAMFVRAGWLALIGFIAVGWIADKWAHSESSVGMQYLGLTLYTVAEALFFVPLLFYASRFGGPTVIPTAGIMTVLLFGGLTAIVLITGKDFSFLSTGLWIAGLAGLGVAVCGAIFGFSLGIFFAGAMAILACGYVLFYTSNVLHHYRTDQHVAAALALFAAVAMLFWYVVRIVMELQRRD